ncbi:MAG: hypothetical protein E5W21_31325, partial [Mesorhizobium sp.]
MARSAHTGLAQAVICPQRFGKEADLPTGKHRLLTKPLARLLALAGLAVALASCQMFTPPDVQE